MSVEWLDAAAVAAAVRSGRTAAAEVTEAALGRSQRENARLNCFTEVFAARARRDAARVDADLAAGRDPGLLAGVPFAVKNLFDVEGVTTLAGSRINRDNAPARRDAFVVAALQRAGAILLGALNMDEYAYGFTTENTHYGATRNPRDLSRVAGGSSGGSAAAVASGVVPLSLGTDTGGSIRVPASLCGLFGLKPTFGRVSRTGTALFSASVDHVGPLARSVRDLALAHDVMHGPDAEDPSCSPRARDPVESALGEGIDGLRIALAGGYFKEHAEAQAIEAAERVARALRAQGEVAVPHAAVGRAAATIVTGVEGAGLHFANLRTRPGDFDPMTRDRFLAAAMLPGAIYARAQAYRRVYRDAVLRVFDTVDVLVAPTTPIAAPLIGQEVAVLPSGTFPSRAHLGRYTIPFSIIGLPVLSVPVAGAGLPRGVQLVAAPFREKILFRAAAFLERGGIAAFTRPG
ncbi:MAG: AtzE family amidohydrolase [Betaproteobacteria bacterium]